VHPIIKYNYYFSVHIAWCSPNILFLTFLKKVRTIPDKIRRIITWDGISRLHLLLAGERAFYHVLEPGPAVRDDAEEDRLRPVISGTAEKTSQMPAQDLLSRTKVAVHGGWTGQSLIFF